ncbi:FAD-dependent monooxygenase [Jiangella alkaliphila]|uniref:FAD-dependent monooxygenase n=1 Tax=Jiangella alkaliphila TaxID=419479 RepID=UPI0009E33754
MRSSVTSAATGRTSRRPRSGRFATRAAASAAPLSSQAEAERILVAHLAQQGVRPGRGVELVGREQHDDAVISRLRGAGTDDETVTARYGVGCEGARSNVRALARPTASSLTRPMRSSGMPRTGVSPRPRGRSGA